MAKEKSSAVGSLGLSGYLKVHAGSRPYTTGKLKVEPKKKADVVERAAKKTGKT